MLSLFNNHEKLEKLGEGTFGEVWRVRIITTNFICAAKYLKRIDYESLNRFRREIRILQELNSNPYIVNFLGAELQGIPYFLMEFCAGKSLKTYVNQITADNVLNIIFGITKALQSIHEKNGFHRDIKPENILFAWENGIYIPKLADFGISRTPHINSLMTNSPMGTIAYMAPEIKRGAAYTQSADIYSLGMSCIEVLTGKIERTHLGNVPIDVRTLLLDMTQEHQQLRPSLSEIENRVLGMLETRKNPISKLINSVTLNDLAVGAAFGLVGAILLNNKK